MPVGLESIRVHGAEWKNSAHRAIPANVAHGIEFIGDLRDGSRDDRLVEGDQQNSEHQGADDDDQLETGWVYDLVLERRLDGDDLGLGGGFGIVVNRCCGHRECR